MFENVIPLPVERDATPLPDAYRRFAEEYLKDFKPNRARLAAGIGSHINAHELLTDPRVQAVIAEGKRKLSDSVNVSVSAVMHNLACIAQTTMPDIMKAIKIAYIEKDGAIGFDVSGLDDEQKAAIKKIKKTKEGFEIELFDKVAATIQIGKYFGIWTDGIAIAGLGSKPVDLINEQMTPEQAAAAYQATLKP